MRFVVVGAGAIGGVVGARLAQGGHSVVLIARGRHYEAIRDRGLCVESPDGPAQLRLPVVNHPSGIAWTDEDVVLLATKSQDSPAALADLASAAPSTTPVVCVQNGVANERMALRAFANVYGVFVFCPTGYLKPGIVQAWLAPMTGILDLGRYPSGVDGRAEELASALRGATFHSEPRTDIMRWKYRKLLMNLGNAVDALCGSAARSSDLDERARREGAACLSAAGIAFASEDEDGVSREKALRTGVIDGRERPGGSSWQSLERGAGSIETDYLNGEISLIGRLNGVPTPVNTLLQRLSREAVRDGKQPGSLSVAEIESLLV